jgi:hypothetical protein
MAMRTSATLANEVFAALELAGASVDEQRSVNDPTGRPG